MIINPRTRMIPGAEGGRVEAAAWERGARREDAPASSSSLQPDTFRLLGTSSSIPGSAGSLGLPGSRDNLGPPGSVEAIRESMIPGSHNSYHSAYSTVRRDAPPPRTVSSNGISTSLPHLGGGELIPTASSLSSSRSLNVYASPACSLPNSHQNLGGYPGAGSAPNSHQNLGGYPGTSGSGPVRLPQAPAQVEPARAPQWDYDRIARQLLPYQEHAQCMEDVNLLACVLDLCRVYEADPETVKLLLRTLKFLRLCDYSAEDICSTMAHATAYFVDAFSRCGNQMDTCEVGNVLTTLIFIAHCYVQDETCPLQVWHQHLFKSYCTLRTLNVAIFRLMEIRRYVLRLGQEDFDRRYFSLLQAATRRPSREAEQPRPRHVDVDLSAQAGSPTRLSPMPEEQGAEALLSRLLDDFRVR